MNTSSTCEVNAEAILEDYREAYFADHGKEPVMVTDGEWVRLDGNDYRITDLPPMTEALRQRAKSTEAKQTEDAHVFSP
jgi:hypothetical protein